MFDPEKLQVGDVFYTIKERNQAFHRNKIHKEINGEDWFRYDQPLRTYELVTYKVFGILRKELKGKWKHDPDGIDLQTEFYLRYQDETHVGHHVEYLAYNTDKYFLDKDEALVYKSKLKTQAKEMDKT